MLEQADLDFIEKLGERFPYVRSNFQLALSIAREERFDWAHDRLYDILRKRYLKYGVPEHDIETVGDHTLESIGIATLYTPEHCSLDTVERMILVHDLPQAVIDNFKCEPTATPEEKKQVERIAARVVFDCDSESFALWQEYEAKQTLEAKIAKDMQQIQMVHKILEYQDAYPALIPNFAKFWDNIWDSWLTDTGREVYRSIEAARTAELFGGRENRPCAA